LFKSGWTELIETTCCVCWLLLFSILSFSTYRQMILLLLVGNGFRFPLFILCWYKCKYSWGKTSLIWHHYLESWGRFHQRFMSPDPKSSIKKTLMTPLSFLCFLNLRTLKTARKRWWNRPLKKLSIVLFSSVIVIFGKQQKKHY